MGRVLAVGVFDIIEPGHLSYLNACAALGEELVVLVVRDEAVTPPPLLAAESRVMLVDAFRVVDDAVLQPHGRIADVLSELDPGILALEEVHDSRPTVLESRLHAIGVEGVTVTAISGERAGRISPVRRATEAGIVDALFGTESPDP